MRVAGSFVVELLCLTLIAPYDPGVMDAGVEVLRGVVSDVLVEGSSLMVSGTSTGRKADASSSAWYSFRRSWGIAESRRASMYRYC